MTIRRFLLLAAIVASVAAIVLWRSSRGPAPANGEAPKEHQTSRSTDDSRGLGPARTAPVPATEREEATEAAPAAAAQRAAPPSGAARLSGRVVARTGESIPGAEVALAGEADDPEARSSEPSKASPDAVNVVITGRGPGGTRSSEPSKASPDAVNVVITDVGGDFTVDLKPGLYRVTSVSAPGFAPFRTPIVFTAEAGRTIDGIVIVLDAYADPRESQLEETGDLPFGGRVVDADDRPVSGAEVSAHNQRGTYGATSGTEGRFEFGPAPGGVFGVYAARGESVSDTVRIQEGTYDAVLRLNAIGGFIAGRVTNPDGDAQSGFTVSLSRPVGRLEERPLEQRPFASVTGEFRIGPIVPGDYRVRADAYGFATSEAKTVKVIAGETAVADLQLRQGATLTGQVVDAAAGTPIVAAVVSLETAYFDRRETRTNAEGRFALAGLPPGLFSVRATAEGFHRRSASGLRAVEGRSVGPVEIRLNALDSVDEEPEDQIVGIGAALGAQGDALVVNDVIAGGGAAEAGLQSGDLILTIDGRAVSELDFNGVIQLIRGPEGSTVLLTIQRDGELQTVNVPRRFISN